MSIFEEYSAFKKIPADAISGVMNSSRQRIRTRLTQRNRVIQI